MRSSLDKLNLVSLKRTSEDFLKSFNWTLNLHYGKSHVNNEPHLLDYSGFKMVPAPRVFQFTCRRLSTLFRATTLLPPRSMRSTAGCQWSYLVAQPGLVTSRCQTSVLSCNNLSSLLSTKLWHESEVDEIMERFSSGWGLSLDLQYGTFIVLPTVQQVHSLI